MYRRMGKSHSVRYDTEHAHATRFVIIGDRRWTRAYDVPLRQRMKMSAQRTILLSA